METYRRKPVVIKAVKWDETHKTLELLQSAGLQDVRYVGNPTSPHVRSLGIWTLEGTMGVLKGDYIIQGIDGEFYPCKADIFKKLHTKELA